MRVAEASGQRMTQSGCDQFGKQIGTKARLFAEDWYQEGSRVTQGRDDYS